MKSVSIAASLLSLALAAVTASALPASARPQHQDWWLAGEGETVCPDAVPTGIEPKPIMMAGVRFPTPLPRRNPRSEPGTDPAEAPPPVMLDAPLQKMVLSSGFGPRNGRFHHGIDLRAAAKAPVRAAGPGRVVQVGRQGALGLTVVVDHGDGYRTRYAHLSAAAVAEQAQVRGGEVIGKVGRSGRATGPHLHYEVEYRGRTIDPLAVLDQAKRLASACALGRVT